MRKTQILLIAVLILSVSLFAENFYSFEAKTIDGETIEMSEFAGKKLMVVNVASKCGFTKQYEDLQALYENYAGEDFEIIAFPANNFRNQEPGTDTEIKKFAAENFGVTFPMMSKISVKGEDIHPIYEWMTDPDEDGDAQYEIKWNFQKFLIDEEGNIVAVHGTKVNPLDDEIVTWIADDDNNGEADKKEEVDKND